MNIIIAVLIFGIIILVHEFGHFILAKVNGIFVTEFSLGMGKRLISFVPTDDGYKFKGFLTENEFEKFSRPLENTIYSIKLLPFGGSCMMLGEDESLEDDRAFNKKGVWARISVVFAGAFFNFILAFVVAAVIVGIIGYDPAIITGVAQESAADLAGLQEGDKISKINNKNISISREANSYFIFNELTDEPVHISYERDNKKHEIELAPQYKENYILGFSYLPDSSPAKVESLIEDYPMENAGIELGDIITSYNGTPINSGEELADHLENNPLTEDMVEIGYTRNSEEKLVEVKPEYNGEGYDIGYTISYGYEEGSFLDAIKYGLVEVKFNISNVFESLKMLVSGRAGMNDLAGPVGIVNIIGDTYEVSKTGGALTVFINLANMMVMLSANVGVINLLPFPALDGGRLVFLFVEAVRKKPVPPEKEGMVHFVGIMALMLLMVIILFNDVRRILPF